MEKTNKFIYYLITEINKIMSYKHYKIEDLNYLFNNFNRLKEIVKNGTLHEEKKNLINSFNFNFEFSKTELRNKIIKYQIFKFIPIINILTANKRRNIETEYVSEILDLFRSDLNLLRLKLAE